MLRQIICFLIFSPFALGQQLTHVFGTVVDPSGLPYRNGRITASLIISNTPFFVGTGQPYTPPQEPTRINDDGFFEMTLANVNQLTPAGATWSFHVCSDRGTVQPGSSINRGAVCFDVTGVVVTGASLDIGALLSASAPRLVERGIEGQVTEINGIAPPGQFINWVGTLGPPPVCLTPTPTNGRCISFLVSASNVSAFLIGDGTTNCLSGLGTYVTCGGGTGGGVGAGTIGQFAGYTTTSSVTGQDFFFSAGSAPPTLTAGTGGIGITTGGIPVFNGGAGSGFNRITAINSVAGTAVSSPSISLVNTGISLPTNAFGLSFASSLPSAGITSIAAYLQGDGLSTDCFIGTGVFSPCPGGTSAGVSSINSVAGAFTFTGAGVSCASTTCTFSGGTGGGIGGGGTPPFLPVFTGSGSTIGNSAITATANTVIVGSPGPLTPNGSAALTAGIQENINQSTASCASGNTIPLNPTSNVGCVGVDLHFNTTNSTTSGTNAGLIVRANGATNTAGTLGMGIAAVENSTATMTEQRAGYFEADSGQFAGTITTSRGLFAVAVNSNGNVASNEAVVAQSGAIGASGVNTNDFSMHCLPPLTGGTLTTHACVKIEAQGTGVEFQTGAHTFAALPACTATYEGSEAAITDSTVTSGTITGGGTNHVHAYCNGSAWSVSGGGGGGTTPPIKVGTCAATGGNCTIIFGTAFVSTPVCNITPNAPSATLTSFNFSSISNSTFSLVYTPTSATATFEWTCFGNPT